MAPSRIELDWSRLLGFDQANPGPDPLKNSPKIGQKEAVGFADVPATAPRAEIGDKGQIHSDALGTTHALQAKIGIKGTVTR